MSQKNHWENTYHTRKLNEVSWYQPTPQVSLDFVRELNLAKDAAIIDVGGGDSFFVDHLLALGFTNVTVLDISGGAIQRAKDRLGKKTILVKWVVSDIMEFVPETTYDFWHDRATFHFLITKDQVNAYFEIARKALSSNGKLVIATFSENGPEKCSGLPVKKYSESSLTSSFKKYFHKIKCIYSDHITPFQTVQQFLFCSFQKLIK